MSSTNGGGVIQTFGSVNITGSTFTNVSSQAYGGVVWSTGTSGSIIFTNNVVNTSRAIQGGSLYSSGATITVSGCNFTSSSSSAQGGVLYFQGPTSFTNNIVNNCFSGDVGGALYVNSVNITGSQFTGCSSSLSGGAVYVTANSSLNVQNTQFQSNSAYLNGSAVYIVGGGY